MSRIVNPAAPPRRVQPAQPVDIASRKAALARAEKVAASARGQADDAWLASLHPVQRAEAMRDRALRADMAAAHLRHEVETYRPVPPPRPALPSPEAVREALVQKALTEAHHRVIELRRLGEFAEKQGAAFDVEAAIASDISLPEARERVMNAAADASEALTIRAYSPTHTAASVSHKDGWDAALAAVVSKHGLTPR